jgi:hypothetical protein
LMAINRARSVPRSDYSIIWIKRRYALEIV